MNRLVVTGATGNTGLHVVRQLKDRFPNLSILALVRSSSDTTEIQKLGIDVLECSLEDISTYVTYLNSSDVVIEMANLRFFRVLETAMNIVGIQRAFCVTTTAVFSSFHSYSALYRDIESKMRQSQTKITILRPSMIYGNERDHNMHKLLYALKKAPIFPIFGDGMSLMQPVHVEDLATGIVMAITGNAIGEFNLAGPEPITYKNLLSTASLALNKRVIFLHLPHMLVAKVVAFAEKIPRFPIKHEQVMRLQENKAFDISDSTEILNYSPRTFSSGIRQEVLRLLDLKML